MVRLQAFPAGQTVQVISPSREKDPCAQATGVESFTRQLLPAGQGLQAEAPEVEIKVPSPQTVQVMTVPPAEKVPAAQGTGSWEGFRQ